MREIKFRGKRIDNGEWVYGCLAKYSKAMSYITVDLIKNEVYQVHTKTVGQYTGLKDKNGKEIYEGDICKWLDLESFNDEIIEDIFVVEWSDEFLKYIGVKEANYHDLYDYTDNTELKVIGNIYENPELLDIEED